MNYVKEGTKCYLSQKGRDDLLFPNMDEGYSSIFLDDANVRIKKWFCDDEELSAVLVEAANIENLVAAHGIETVVWVNKNEIIKV